MNVHPGNSRCTCAERTYPASTDSYARASRARSSLKAADEEFRGANEQLHEVPVAVIVGLFYVAALLIGLMVLLCLKLVYGPQ